VTVTKARAQPHQIPPRKFQDKPLEKYDIFVDDFIGAAQGSKERLIAIRRVLLHTLDELFRPLEDADNPHRRKPASTKKLDKGDAYWETRKLILGWILDTLRMTIEMPQRQVDCLRKILDSIPPDQKRTTIKKWHKLLGELRSMSIALPGA
jgi:hypothetical protein